MAGEEGEEGLVSEEGNSTIQPPLRSLPLWAGGQGEGCAAGAGGTGERDVGPLW